MINIHNSSKSYLLHFTVILIGFFLLNANVLAEECKTDSIKTNSSLPLPFFDQPDPSLVPNNKHDGIAYGTGDCRDECKEWGSSVNPTNDEKLYKSYHYIAWNTGLRVCTVSSDHLPDCPRVGNGISECNY